MPDQELLQTNRETRVEACLAHGFIIPFGWLLTSVGIFKLSELFKILYSVPLLLYYVYAIPIIVFHLTVRIWQPTRYTLKAYAIFQIVILLVFCFLAYFSEENILVWIREVCLGMLVFQALLFFQYAIINFTGVTAFKFLQGKK